MSSLNWDNWLPYRIKSNESEVKIFWKQMDNVRFSESFYMESFAKSKTFFPRESDWSVISKIAKSAKSIKPTGFIFHSSRCGSTLISQLFAKSKRNIVLSEVPFIDFALSNTNEEEKIEKLQEVIKVIGQQRFSFEENLFIKFDAWNIAELPLIHKIYPSVPWIFLYRNPIEILVSHERIRGMHMVPQIVKGKLFDTIPQNIPFEEYSSIVLAEIFKTALKYKDIGKGELINYKNIHSILDKLPTFFDVELTIEEKLQMKQTMQVYSKNPSEKFKSDSKEKQKEASESLKKFAEKWVSDIYIELENVESKFF